MSSTHTCDRSLQTLLLVLFLLRWTRISWLQLKGRGIFGSSKDLYFYTRRKAFGVFFRLPGVRDKIEGEVKEASVSLEKKLTAVPDGVQRYSSLPKQGWTSDEVKSELTTLSTMKHTRWEDGLVSGAVYHGGQDLADLQAEAFKQFTVANPIHPDVFPGVRKMEAEVVSMVLRMFNAPEDGAGTTTSGGTESILMACLSARQKAYYERGVTEPEM